MENVRIASTPLAGLRPVGPVTNRDHGRLNAALAGGAGGGGDLRLLFAEPVPSRDSQHIDWYGPGDRTYTAFAALPAEEQATLLAKVDALLGVVRDQGDRLAGAGDSAGEALLGALTVPSPRQNYIYLAREVGNPGNWQPVIVGWAYTNDVASRAGERPQVMVRPPPPPPSTPGLPPPFVRPAAVFASAPAMAVEGPRRGWRWLLWLALTVLLLSIAWLMLRYCAVVLPGYGVWHDIGRSFCPGMAAAAATGEDERRRQLTELTEQLQLQIVKRQVDCVVETRRAEATRLGAEQQEREKADQEKKQQTADRDKKDLEDRLKREKAQTGDLQVSLIWDGPSDLDLHVFCPNGEEIYYSRKASCGGTLDVDMNSSNNKSLTPVENVFWPDGKVPKGKFRVVVTKYDRHGDQQPQIPFQVRVKNGADVQTYPGTIKDAPVEVTEISR